MPVQIIPVEVRNRAKHLHAQGFSIREIARLCQISHYRARVILEHGYQAKNQLKLVKYRRDNPDLGKRQYLRAEARLQAKLEGVPNEEVYIRWGVPTIKSGPKPRVV